MLLRHTVYYRINIVHINITFVSREYIQRTVLRMYSIWGILLPYLFVFDIFHLTCIDIIYPQVLLANSDSRLMAKMYFYFVFICGTVAAHLQLFTTVCFHTCVISVINDRNADTSMKAGRFPMHCCEMEIQCIQTTSLLNLLILISY